MKYYSLHKQSPVVDFREATINGQAPDKGLYFPEYIPKVDASLISNIENISNEEIAFRVIKPYVGHTINDERLFQIVKETIHFPIPLVQVTDSISSLELFHGPTLAFKDIGARFMSRCLGEFVKNNKAKVTVLVATSGDTGGAVANGFYEVDGIEVVILYPSGKVSAVQELQLTTLGKNIKALEVKGTFDDCQAMVKQAFSDKDVSEKRFLTSANSINVARWLPQQFYYFFAYKQWKEKNHPPVVCVPSGNFGNICAGILAYCSGLPVKHFIAACNSNDVIPQYLQTANYQPKTAKPTYSNAMDVGDPSNFVRIMELFGQQYSELKKILSGFSISDEATYNTIQQVYQHSHYTLDPHGAVGYLSLKQYLSQHPEQKGFFLETAHPVKFPEVVEKATGQKIEIPEQVTSLFERKKEAALMDANYSKLKEYLLNNI
jgi:threonine synthase